MTVLKEESLVFQVAEIKFSKDGFNIVRTTSGYSVAGKFNAKEGYCYKAEGVWETHPTFGPQYKLTSATMVKHVSPEALGRFLVYQMRGKGVGEAVIANLVDAAKTDNLDLEDLLDRSARATLVECVGTRNAKKIDLLLEHWPKIKPESDLMSPLLGYGLSEAICETLITLYGKKAIDLVENDPYELITTVDGVSFLKADQIATKVGRIAKRDPKRIRAALSTGMRDATSNGDIGVKRAVLLEKTMPLLNEAVVENNRRILDLSVPLHVPQELLSKFLDEMISGKAVDEDGKPCKFASKLVEFPDEKGNVVVWYAPLVEAEKVIANRLYNLSTKCPARPDLVAMIDTVAAELGATLHPKQREAIEKAFMHPVSIITGGPGMGKSFLLNVLFAVLDRAGLRGVRGAPTGKAAKRIREATGRDAGTLHSILGLGPGGRVAFNESCPLDISYMTVDETSMVDTESMSYTMAAVPDGARLILVGDIDQLASVGPGQILRDLMRSGKVPVTRLEKGYRFSGGISEAAQEVNSGKVPSSSTDGQFVFVETSTPAEDLKNYLLRLKAEGVDEDDIQILSPTHKHAAGCIALNQVFQNIFNPDTDPEAPRLKRDGGDIRMGDRVIQVKNDKDTGLVNGDIGWVSTIDSDLKLGLELPDRDQILYLKKAGTIHLKLAGGITVHKSQGAESPIILMALDPAATFMLNRSLVYTGITRAKKQCVVFSQFNTLSLAVRKGQPPEGTRRTSLVQKILAKFGGPSAKPADPLSEAMKLDFADSDEI